MNLPERESVCVLICRAGRFVAVESIKHGKLEVPGGKVEPGETEERAIRRETFEEIGKPLTGAVLEIGRIQHVFGGVLWKCVVFVGRIEGDPIGGDDGLARLATREELLMGTYGVALRDAFKLWDQWVEMLRMADA